MDSLTQITLGAAVGEATLGRRVGNKAPLWGAFFGTLPDLDVVINPFVSEITSLAFHRGLSHSFLVVVVAAPLLAWMVSRIHASDGADWRAWTPLVLLTLVTHIILDTLTSYGTQVFAPLSDTRAAIPSIFIIDPVYTIPLALGLLIALKWRPTATARRRSNYIGLAVSTVYLCLTLGIKSHVESVFASSLEAQGKPHTEVFTQPTPFNTILWNGMVQDEGGTWTGQYSLFDSSGQIEFEYVPKNDHLLQGHMSDPAIDVLRWFSKGYYTVSQENGTTRLHDLRFGRTDLGLRSEGRYLFTFVLKQGPDGAFVNFAHTRPPFRPDDQLLRRFVNRIAGEERSSSQAVLQID
ncbi:metal-dependent hydrolase [Longibacter salinarum]|uniref:metal-dependent hydrolase n=1 Tax=Longibacter salinarum TaxID=1850348 RepID=UPI0015CF655C|nr:metal-dependent hydrolase [Longibacter salinarum]